MTGIIMSTGFQTTLRTTITLGNSGAGAQPFGYRTTGGFAFGSMGTTSWAGLTITDLYSDNINDLVITFNSAPSNSILFQISGGDSFGGSYSVLRSSGVISGNSFVWASALGYNPYASSGPTLTVTLRR